MTKITTTKMYTENKDALKSTWHIGFIEVTSGSKTTLFRFEVKAYDHGSGFGIDEGRISKLYLETDAAPVAWYERGWIMDTADGEAQVAVERLIKEFN